MTKLTEKQQKFAINKAAGVKNREAAIAAGYAPNNADVQATNLLRRDDIKSAIKAARPVTPGPECVAVLGSKDVMPRKHYADPMTFLEDVMNQSHLPIALRVDAARQLLPYKHARIGEVGKKQAAKERAHAMATKSRFSPKAPPPMLRAIKSN